MATKGENSKTNTERRKRQVRTGKTQVSDHKLKLKRLEEEIEVLKGQNAELTKLVSQNSVQMSSNNHSSKDNHESSLVLGMEEIKSIIPEFNPANEINSNALAWGNNIESLKIIYKWNEKITLFYASSRLGGAAATWFASKQGELDDWGKLRKELVRCFPSVIDTSSILLKIMMRKRQHNECIENYFYDIVTLGKKINLPEVSIIKHIISNINNQSLSTVLMSINQTNPSLDELLLHIKRCEEISQTEKQSTALLSCSRTKTRELRQGNYQNEYNNPLRYHPFKNNSKKVFNDKTREKRCFKCGKNGHFANSCPAKIERKCYTCNTPGHYSRECQVKTVKNIELKEPKPKNEYYQIVMIERNPVLAYLDLGSECTTLRMSETNMLGFKIEKCDTILYGFGGTKNKVKGKIHKPLAIGEFEYDIDIMIVDDSNQTVPMIVGRNFLDREGLKVVKRWGVFNLEKDILIDEDKFNKCEEAVLSVSVLKPMDKDLINIEMNINCGIKDNLYNLINKFRNCFALNHDELGNTDIEQMKIVLKQEKIIKYRPYKVPYALQETLDKIISELLEAKIIHSSTSEYASPVLLVKKKEGDYRMCVDYRQLNAITKREAFPVPNIEETLNSLANKAVFTSLDLLSGYYQIKVAEGSQQFTSFVTPSGQYEFSRMPFGLTNSPSVFMRVMAKILEPIKSDKIIVYMDDILIATKTIDENLKVLEQFLQVLQKAGLTLKLEKCIFFQSSIQFLGHEISIEGIKPGAIKTAVIENYKQPQNVKGVRQFLGLSGYFRRFIKNYALIARPLNKLLRKGEEFQWNDETEKAFQILKSELVKKPVLTIYDVEKEHELHTDASSHGLAGILMQREDDGALKAVSFFSRATTSAEAKYHSYELEALAVVESLERFKFYLLNKHFKVVTDCLSLKLTKEKRDIIPRIARWWLRILEFDFELVYRKGSNLSHVDALSRNPHELPVGNDTVAARVMVVDVETEDWLSTLQTQDPKLLEIKRVLNGSLADHTEKFVIKNNFLLRENRIYKKTSSGEKFVVPNGLRWKIIKAAHDDMGHCGHARTLNNIRKLFWFSNMSPIVKKYIKSCIDCVFNKSGENENKFVLYEPERQPIPFYTIHMDHLGPYPKSKQRNEYVIGLIDSFTKFIVLKAVRNTSTRNVIKLLDEVTQYFGMPTRIITDRGTAYTSKDFEKYCSANLIKHVKVAVKTPRANGQIERYFRTVKAAINSMTELEDGKDWDTKLAAIQWSLNSMRHSTTKQTPQEILMDYKPRSIQKNKLILALHDGSRKDDDEDIPLAQLREKVLRRMKEKQSIQTFRHNSSKKPPTQFEVGDLVMIRREPIATGQSRKLQPRYKGPYEVKKKLGNDRYVVADSETLQITQKPYESIHSAEHLKRWMNLKDADFDLRISDNEDDKDDDEETDNTE